MVQPAIIWRRRTSSAGSRSDGLAPFLASVSICCDRPIHFCPVTLAGQLGLQLVIREHRAALEVDTHHLARADAAAFDDALFRHDDHSGLGSGDHKPSSVTT